MFLRATSQVVYLLYGHLTFRKLLIAIYSSSLYRQAAFHCILNWNYSVCFLSVLSLAAVGYVIGEMKEAVYPAGSRGVKVPFVRIESQEQPGAADGEPYAYTEPECVLSMDEQKKLQNEAVSAAEMCAGYYSAEESVNSSKDSGYASVIELTEQQRRDIVNVLGNHGMVSVSDDMNMRNYEDVENFYSQGGTGYNLRSFYRRDIFFQNLCLPYVCKGN